MLYWYALIGYVLLFGGGYHYVKRERFEKFHMFVLLCLIVDLGLLFWGPDKGVIDRILLVLLAFQANMLRTEKTFGDRHENVKERMKQEVLRYGYLDYRIQANVAEDKSIIHMTDHVFDLLKEQWMEQRKKMEAAVTIRHKKTKNTIILELKLDHKCQSEHEIQKVISCLSKYYDCTYKKKGVRKKYHRLTICSAVID